MTSTAATSYSASFTTITGQTTGPSLNFTTTSGALTIAGASANVNGGVVNLTGAGGVVLNAQLGSSTTGAISINGPLTGSSNIVEGTGTVSITQSTNSTYSGIISGNQAVAVSGGGVLTVNGSNSYSSATSITGATLTVSGSSLTATSGVNVGTGGVLAGDFGVTGGTVNPSGTITANGGAISPGGTGVGILNTGSVAASSRSTLIMNINSTGGGSPTPGTDYDQLAVTGSMNLNNFTPVIFLGASPALTVGSAFTIITTTGGVSGTFTAGVFAAADNTSYIFTPSISGNNVVLTLTAITSQLLDVSSGFLTYTTATGVNSNLTVTNDGTNFTVTDTAGPITLTANATSNGWTGSGTTTVQGPMAGITGLVLGLTDGSDTISGIAAGSVPTLTIGYQRAPTWISKGTSPRQEISPSRA